MGNFVYVGNFVSIKSSQDFLFPLFVFKNISAKIVPIFAESANLLCRRWFFCSVRLLVARTFKTVKCGAECQFFHDCQHVDTTFTLVGFFDLGGRRGLDCWSPSSPRLGVPVKYTVPSSPTARVHVPIAAYNFDREEEKIYQSIHQSIKCRSGGMKLKVQNSDAEKLKQSIPTEVAVYML
jgi:hypothetical protein